MGKKTGMDWLTRGLMLFLVLMMAVILVRVITKEVLIDKLDMNNGFTALVLSDVDALSDLDVQTDGGEGAQDDDAGPAGDAPAKTAAYFTLPQFAGLDRGIDLLKQKVDIYSSKQIVYRDKMVEMANSYNGVLDWELDPPEEYNSVFFLKNGYLASRRHQNRQIDAAVTALQAMHSKLEARGIPLLFVQVPDKVCKYAVSDTLFDGITTFANQNADSFAEKLQGTGIKYMDLREVLHGQGLDHHGLYFKTDHHWKPETALWAAGEIAGRLNTDFGFSIDTALFAPDRYDYKVYADWFLGSQGKKVTLSRVSPDDITLIYPKFDTSLSLEIPERKLSLSGDFDIIYDYKQIEEKDLYKLSPYAAYFYSNNPISKLVNHREGAAGKLLVFGESFDNSLLPFLALGVKEIDSVDMRLYKEPIDPLLDSGEYDMVIYIYSTTFLFPEHFRSE